MPKLDACWASCLDNCSDKLSREHLVSGGLFTDNSVMVEGFPWCKGQAVKIGLSGLTSKILCEKHNNDLSDVDTAGIRGFKVLREMRRLANVREKLKQERWRVFRDKVNGYGLELWCLKTLINLCCDRQAAIGRDSTVAGGPSERLVRIAYGLEKFKGRAGLYFAARVGMNIQSEDTVRFAPLLKQGVNVEGGLFSFRGQRLLLFLEDEGPPQPLRGVSIDGEDLGDAQLNFHLKEIKVMQGEYLSEILTFEW